MWHSERLFRQVLAIHPRHADTLHMLGAIAHRTGRDDLAYDLISRAIASDPTNASSHSNLGNLLVRQGRLDEAIAAHRRSLALAPNAPETLNNLANALKARQHLAEAIATYRAAIALRPNEPEQRYNLALALLASGDLPAGWAEHEWRWKTRQFLAGRRAFAQPQWRGEPAEGRTLLIHAEQGLGDTLQFCRYARLATERGLRVVLEVQPALVRLLSGLPGVERVLARGDALPPFDLHCPMLSLPLAFGTTVSSIPGTSIPGTSIPGASIPGASIPGASIPGTSIPGASDAGDVPYLRADAALASAWRARLAALEQSGPRIGLVWAGNPRREQIDLAAVDRRRSIAPDRLAPLVGVSGAHFFSLQKDGPPAPPHAGLADFMGEIEDFADTAALVANLDLVISVDTSVAHLAAGMGRPVWLLDRFDPCWRWLTGRRDSPWYPGPRIYRQPKPGDWEPVLAEVARDLRDFVSR